jgi:hypothetical protein
VRRSWITSSSRRAAFVEATEGQPQAHQHEHDLVRLPQVVGGPEHVARDDPRERAGPRPTRPAGFMTRSSFGTALSSS